MLVGLSSVFFICETQKRLLKIVKNKKQCCLSKKPKLDKDKIWGQTSALK